MAGDRERKPFANLRDDAGNRRFQITRYTDIAGCSAHGARHVVVMPGQPLGQLKTGNTGLIGEPFNDVGLLENGQRPVQRRKRDGAGQSRGEISRRLGTGRSVELLDDQPAGRGESEILALQAISGSRQRVVSLTHRVTQTTV